MPDNFQIFARRIEAAIEAGDETVLDEVRQVADRPANGSNFLWAIGILLTAGDVEAARTAIGGFRRAGGSADRGALAEARLLERCGDDARAMAVLEPHLRAARPFLPLLRAHYRLSETAALYDASYEVSARAAVLHGEAHDLNHAFDLALFFFCFADAMALVERYRAAHPGQRDAADQLAHKCAAAEAAAAAARAEHGGGAVDRRAILQALRNTAATPQEILWAKQTLIALTSSPALAESDIKDFGEYAVNWEDARIRNHVLRVGITRFPTSPSIQQRWIRWLMSQRRYGTASRFLLDHMAEAPLEVVVFTGVMLLNIARCAIAPTFLTASEADRLLDTIGAALPDTSVGFRTVMHEQLRNLGIDAGPWPVAGQRGGADDLHDHLRFLGRMTGRLHRVEASSRSPSPSGPAARPIVAISGQLRGFEAAWPGMVRFVVEPLEAPLVLTTWDRSTNARGRHGRRLERLLPADVHAALTVEERFSDVFEEHYPQTAALLFSETQVAASDLRQVVDDAGVACLGLETESDAALEEALAPVLAENMLKMFYKWSRAEHLIAAAERASSQLYTHVVWLRPDCKISALPVTELRRCLRRDDVVYSSWGSDAAVGDYMMVLPRAAFAAVASVFPRVAAAGSPRLFPWRPYNRSKETLSPPETIFDVLLSEGFSPFGRMAHTAIQLPGRTPPPDVISRTFFRERAGRS